MNYKTQLEAARKNIITEQISLVAKKENRSPEWISERVSPWCHRHSG